MSSRIMELETVIDQLEQKLSVSNVELRMCRAAIDALNQDREAPTMNGR